MERTICIIKQQQTASIVAAAVIIRDTIMNMVSPSMANIMHSAVMANTTIMLRGWAETDTIVDVMAWAVMMTGLTGMVLGADAV